MNGKRVKSAIMSAVILSAVAVSGCSADGGVSLNESGMKAELSAFFNTSGKDESAETESRRSSDSISVSTTDIFSDCNRIVFRKNNKIYVFDKNGKCYSDGKYDKTDNDNQELYYLNGYLPVCKSGKWGLIDVNGNEVVKCRFDDISSVYDGKAWAKQNGKWGVIELA